VIGIIKSKNSGPSLKQQIADLLDRVDMAVSVVPAEQPNCPSCDRVLNLLDSEDAMILREALRKQDWSNLKTFLYVFGLMAIIGLLWWAMRLLTAA